MFYKTRQFPAGFPYCGKISAFFSILWKFSEKVFHGVEKSGRIFHTVENIFPYRGKSVMP